MATSPEIVSSEYKFGFHDDVDYLEEDESRLDSRDRRGLSAGSRASPRGCSTSVCAYEHYLSRPMPEWGAISPDRPRQDRYYRKPFRGEEKSWDDVRTRSRRPSSASDSGGRTQFLAASARSTTPKWSTTASARSLSKIGVVFMAPIKDSGVSGALQEVLCDSRAAEDNKFAASTARSGPAARSCTCQGRRGPAAGFRLLPHQRREHRPVRADPESSSTRRQGSYIEGCTAPIYTTDALHAAGRRGDRAAAEGPLHDDPELVERRVQPRHQARPRPRPLDSRVDRREYRFAIDYEVPKYLFTRRGRHGESSRGGQVEASTRTPAPRRFHLAPNTRQPNHQQVDLQGRRPDHISRPAQRSCRATGVVASVRCDALLLDEGSRSDTYPYIDIQKDDTTMTHEATVGKISQDRSST